MVERRPIHPSGFPVLKLSCLQLHDILKVGACKEGDIDGLVDTGSSVVAAQSSQEATTRKTPAPLLA